MMSTDEIRRVKLSLIVDFYYLSAAQFHMWTRPQPPEDAENINVRDAILRTQVDYHLRKVTDWLAEAFVSYAFLAGFGEARHADDESEGSYPEELPVGDGRSSAVRVGCRFDPFTSWEALYRVFSDNTWSSSYGGDNWAAIARAISLYEVNRGIFVDHIIDLKHNGGSLFDKSAAMEHAGLVMDMDEAAIMRFLTYKAEANLWDADDYGSYVHLCSPETIQVLKLAGRRLSERERFRIRAHVFAESKYPDDGASPLAQFGTDKLGSGEWLDTDERGYDGYCESCGDGLRCTCGECAVYVDGDLLCKYCYREHYTECESCYEHVSNDDIKRHAGKFLCEGCYDEQVGECSECGEMCWLDDMEDGICPDCMVTCEKCGYNYIPDEIEMADTGEKYCLSCAAEVRNEQEAESECTECADQEVETEQEQEEVSNGSE